MECTYQRSVLANGAFGLIRHGRRRVDFPTQFQRQGFAYERYPAQTSSVMRHIYDIHEVLGTWRRRNMYPMLVGIGEKAGFVHLLRPGEGLTKAGPSFDFSFDRAACITWNSAHSRTHAERRVIEEAR